MRKLKSKIPKMLRRLERSAGSCSTTTTIVSYKDCLKITKIKFKYFPEISLHQSTFNDVLFRGKRLAKNVFFSK